MTEPFIALSNAGRNMAPSPASGRFWRGMRRIRRREVWAWQSADCAMGKARLGGCHWPQPHRPGQGKAGRKLSLLVGGKAAP